MQLKNHSERTLEKWQATLTRFLNWCAEREICELTQLTPELIAAYQRYLFYYRKPVDQQPLHRRTQVYYLGSVRSWCRWLVKQKLLAEEPTAGVEYPKLQRSLPTRLLSEDQVAKVMNLPDLTTPVGLRDRAMLETFYSTAIRRSELTQLDVYDLDAARGVLVVRRGKGGKDRIVPIGETALYWLDRYLSEVRPGFVAHWEEHALFVSYRGRRFHRNFPSIAVRQYLRRAGVSQTGSCHLFRHTAVTQMLERGADIRCLQALLGHASLESTQVYTHVSIPHLREVHRRTHPASRTGPEE